MPKNFIHSSLITRLVSLEHSNFPTPTSWHFNIIYIDNLVAHFIVWSSPRYSSRFRPGPTSPSSSSTASSSSNPPPPPSAGAPPPPPQSRSVSQRGASAPPERNSQTTSGVPITVADHRRTLHAGVPLTGPGLSGSANSTGATTTIRVGGSGNSSVGYGRRRGTLLWLLRKSFFINIMSSITVVVLPVCLPLAIYHLWNCKYLSLSHGYSGPPSYDAATVATAPIRRLRDNPGNGMINNQGGPPSHRPLPSSTSTDLVDLLYFWR